MTNQHLRTPLHQTLGLRGLHDAQWPGNPDLVRIAFAASAALRFGLIRGLWLVVKLAGGKDGHEAVEAFYDQPVDAVVEHFTTVLPWLLDWGDEARRLLSRAHGARER